MSAPSCPYCTSKWGDPRWACSKELSRALRTICDDFSVWPSPGEAPETWAERLHRVRADLVRKGEQKKEMP